MQAKLAILARKVKLMKLEKLKTVKAVESCSLCVDSSHKTQDFHIMPMMENRVNQLQVSKLVNQGNNPHSKTYNPRWRNHPNFSWKNEQVGKSS